MSETPNVKPVGSQVDLIEMARFLVLPGAQQLLTAFARIPPGELRMSVITHAEVIARTYTSAPAEQQMPDPLYMAASGGMPVLVAPGETPEPRPPMTEEEEIIKLRLEGLSKPQIMQRMPGVHRQKVEAALKGARKAGVDLPPVDAKTDASKLRRFITDPQQISGQGMITIRRAAEGYGHTVESYMAARKTLVEMRLLKKPMDEIAAAIRPAIPEEVLWRWLYAARSAGYDLATSLDYEEAVIEPVAADAPEAAQDAPPEAKAPKRAVSRRKVVPGRGKPIFTPLKKTFNGGIVSIRRAAAARNMTPEAFFELRESIIVHRYAGKGEVEIYSLVGQDMTFIKNTLFTAKEKGVVFPPVSSTFDSAGFTRSMKEAGTPVRVKSDIGHLFGGHATPKPKLVEPPAPKPDPAPKPRPDFPLWEHEASRALLLTIQRESLQPGQTMADYFAVRREAVKLFATDMKAPQIAATLGITVKQAQNWRHRAFLAGLYERRYVQVAAE